ncbi:MAG TPA: type II CAAX endopeptidase family protein [Anaerolineales bacterium]
MEPASASHPEALSLRQITPGLAYILLLDLAVVSGVRSLRLATGADSEAWWLVIGLLPWATLLVLRRSPSALGFSRRRALAEFGWGVLAGAIWRGLSLIFNWKVSQQAALGIPLSTSGSPVTMWVTAILMIPWMEETFFRGYLGRPLASRFGAPAGVLLQATAFTLHPGHWAQGWPHLASIAVFGILAGALVVWRRNLWVGLGAHAMANCLPYLLIALSRS